MRTPSVAVIRILSAVQQPAAGLSLTSPTGGWIGTIAHIVGAEPDGPRGHSPITAQQRAAADNLMLMCATHGREVDAPDTDETNFPVDRLRLMKAEHETKATAAVTAAIEQDQSGVPTDRLVHRSVTIEA